MKNFYRKLKLMKKNLLIIFILVICCMPLQSVMAQGSAEVGVFQAYSLAPGSRIEIPIEVRGVQDLYAIDLELQFDPAILGAEDADPNLAGIQAALGTFLDAGLLLVNEIDLDTGVVRFVMSQVNPSEPKSGDGILLVLYLTAKTAGESNLMVNSITLSDRFGVEIPSSGLGAVITITEDAPAVTHTSIPVQDPTSLIVFPTIIPTMTYTPTATSLPTATPMPTATAMPEPTSTQKPASVEPQPTEMTYLPNVTGGEQEESGSWLQQNWWIIVLAALITAGAGVYLLIQKKKTEEEADYE